MSDDSDDHAISEEVAAILEFSDPEQESDRTVWFRSIKQRNDLLRSAFSKIPKGTVSTRTFAIPRKLRETV
jgi:hypothetical protein